MKEKIIEFIITNFSFLPAELVVLVISAMPILELRGGLPVAYGYYEFGFWKAFLLSILGNTLPVLPLLILFQPISKWMVRFKWYQKFYDWLYFRAVKNSKNVERYGALGLILFTAVPLPTTGAYSACVVAAIFAIRSRFAFLAIFIGILIAGLTVGLVTYSIF